MNFSEIIILLFLIWLFFPYNGTTSVLKEIKIELSNINNSLNELKNVIKNTNKNGDNKK